MAALRSAPASATGATVLLPDGTSHYVSRATAEAMAPPAPSHSEQMAAIHREAAGVMTLDVVLREDMPDLVHAALANAQTFAGKLLTRVNLALGDIAKAPATKPKLCATCPRLLGGGRFSIVLATPACDDPQTALALAVCHDCGTSRGAVRNKAIEALRRLWPDARPIDITHPDGGRA